MFGYKTSRDAIVHPPMDFGAQPIHRPVERAERREVDCGDLQHLDCPVDEVGRITHGLGRLENGADDQLFGRIAIRRDGKVGTNRGLVAIQRLGPACLVRPRLRCGAPKLRGQVGHGAGMDRVRRREAPEIPARLQQRRQHQAAHVAPGTGTNEGEVRLGQVVSGAQLLAGQPRAWARVGRAVDRRHGMSGKRVRRSGRESKCFEGGRR